MFIRAVDEGLERLLRATLPLPEEHGDVVFEPPTPEWAARLSRPAVSLFLYDISRSSQLPNLPARRVDEDGRRQRRGPQPMIDLGYLVSAWAGSARDEHELLGNVLNRLAEVPVLAGEHIPATLNSAVTLSLGVDSNNPLREIWAAAGGQLKASFTLRATVAADAVEWREEAPAVTAVTGAAVPRPRAR